MRNEAGFSEWDIVLVALRNYIKKTVLTTVKIIQITQSKVGEILGQNYALPKILLKCIPSCAASPKGAGQQKNDLAFDTCAGNRSF